MVTNPLDVMTYLMYRITGFPRERVMEWRASSTPPVSARF